MLDLKWVEISSERSSAVRAVAWKRYPSEATKARTEHPRGVLFIYFRKNPQYVYAYYDVDYDFFNRFMSSIKSMGKYVRQYLHVPLNGFSRYRYERIYI